MKKWILLLLSLLLFPFIVFFGCFALMSGDHHYRRDDIISYWLYTPDILKKVPQLSKEVEYEHYYDLDDQHTYVVIKWSNINDIIAKKHVY